MAAPNEPSDGAVDQVVMVTGLQPGDAIKWLKVRCTGVLEMLELKCTTQALQQ